MSIPVGTLTIEMAANVARLQKDMAAAKKTVNDAMTSIKSGASSAMNALAGLGVTLSVAAFASYIKGAIDAADKLNDLSKATAISGWPDEQPSRRLQFSSLLQGSSGT